MRCVLQTKIQNDCAKEYIIKLKDTIKRIYISMSTIDMINPNSTFHLYQAIIHETKFCFRISLL